MYRLSLLAIVAAAVVATTCHAFQPSSLGAISPTGSRTAATELFQAKPTKKSSAGVFSFAGNAKNKSIKSNSKVTNKKSVGKKKADDDKESTKSPNLILAYMTPWRNPNSIFVYMFGLLYALGKYSESH